MTINIEKVKARINEIDKLLDFAGCGQIVILETGGMGGPSSHGDARKELLEERRFLNILLRIM